MLFNEIVQHNREYILTDMPFISDILEAYSQLKTLFVTKLKLKTSRMTVYSQQAPGLGLTQEFRWECACVMG